MNAIVAAGKNWEIGNRGELLVRIPNDQKMFRMETEGKVVVYGRKTLATFPGTDAPDSQEKHRFVNE